MTYNRRRAPGLYRRPRRYREGYGYAIFVAIMLILALVNGARVINQWSNCNEAGGKMVQGLSTTGYVCVEGK